MIKLYTKAYWLDQLHNCLIPTFIYGTLINTIFWANSNLNITLYLMYAAIITLGILIHVVLLKIPNLTCKSSGYFKTLSNKKHNIYLLGAQIFFLQLQIFIITNWLQQNIILLHQQSNFSDLLNIFSLDLDNLSLILINGVGSWLIFISIFLGISIYKYYFRVNRLVVAKYLIPDPNTKFKAFIHNLFLGAELYLRVGLIHLMLIVITINLFKYFSNKYNIHNFWEYPVITPFLIVIILAYSHVTAKKIIGFLCKKTNFGLMNILIGAFGIIAIIIFIIMQLCLYQLNALNIILDIKQQNTMIIRAIIDHYSNEQAIDRFIFVGLNILVNLGLITNVLINSIHNFKLTTIYKISCIFPVSYILLNLLFDFHKLFQRLLSSEVATFIILIHITFLLNYYYKKIHHLLCYFKIKNIMDNSMSKFKVNFESIVYKLILIGFAYLNFYYFLGSMFIQYFLSVVVVFSLPMFILTLIKILYSIREGNIVKVEGCYNLN